MGIIPKWVSEFPEQFWKTITGIDKPVETGEGYKTGIGSWFRNVGSGIKDVVEPVLQGARKALTPTIIWLVVVAVIALFLFFGFKKAVKI
jgi:hypothetical protein